MWKLMKQRTKEYCKKKNYAYKYDNLDETDKFLKRHKLSKLTQEQITKLNNLLYTKEIKFEDKNPPTKQSKKGFPQKKQQAQVASLENLTKH